MHFRFLLVLFCFFISFNSLADHHTSTQVSATTQDIQSNLSPEAALQKLIKGNDKFLKQSPRARDYDSILAKVSQGQYPFAFVFHCVDSRSVPAILFDQTLGNIFTGAIAGNVADPFVLGSMEFATQVAGSKIIVVMGHTSCGAVQGACQGVKLGLLTGLLDQIQPAVLKVKKEEGKDFDCQRDETVNAIAKQNVLNQMKYILTYSKIINSLVHDQKILLVGAMQNIATGKVDFFNEDGLALSSTN